jgi:hypothetical protein
MKTIILSELLALLTAVPLAGNVAQASNPPEGSWSATLISMNSRNNTVTAKNWLLTRRFTLGAGCAVSCVEKPQGTLNDLQPGEEITIRYHHEHGVLVADRMVEETRHVNGTVASVDSKQGFITVTEAFPLGRLRPHKGFRLASDCAVMLPEGTSRALETLKPGERVTIIYGGPSGLPVAYRIQEQTSPPRGS